MSDPTAFELDARQRAMLEEMGVRVWWPEAPRPASPAPSAPTAQSAPSLAAGTLTPPAPVAAARSVPAARPVPVAPEPAGGPISVVAADAVAHMDWQALRAAVSDCQACGLCQGRQQTVFGVGDVQARWMVIGEAPGEHEDRQGEPFVGQAGQLLDQMLRAIGLSRSAQGEAGVYIANTLKCRPPHNRNPEPAELAACAPFLMRQLALVQPAIILAMGRFAVQSLLQTQEPIGRLRGRVHQVAGVPVVVTYHPAYLLRNPADKAKAWEDLCLALEVARPAA